MKLKIIYSLLFSLFFLNSCSIASGVNDKQLNQYYLAKKLYVNNEISESKKITESVYKDNPDFYQNSHLHGKLLFYSGFEEQAIEIWAELLESYPYYIDTVKEVSRYYITVGNYNRAEVILNKALSWSSEDPTLLYILAKVYTKKNEYEKALSLLSQAEAYMERQVEIPIEQAALYQQYGFYNKAVTSINKAISLVNKDNTILPALKTLKESLKNEQM